MESDRLEPDRLESDRLESDRLKSESDRIGSNDPTLAGSPVSTLDQPVG